MAHSPSASSAVIHIPATEFPTSRTPPPHPRPKPCFSDRARRRMIADHHRAAAIQSMTHRCRAHVRHATNVATAVKAQRLADAQSRHRALANTLTRAQNRRLQHLSRRARTSPSRPANLQRQHKDRNSRYQSRHLGRLKAGERRSRILSERSQRAARFSPPRNNPLSDTSSTMSFDSPVARTLNFDDDDSQLLGQPWLPSSVSEAPDSSRCKAAASRIASYYLLASARRALAAAGVLGPQIAEYDFAKLTACLETQEAQDAAELVLRALGLRDGVTHSAARKAGQRRVLLSCLVIALHPEGVLERRVRDTSSQEALTLYCARSMLLCLQFGTLSALDQAWNWWKTTFAVWKKRDAETMLRTMIEDAVATESMRVAVNKGFMQSENVRVFKNALGGVETEKHLDSGQQEHAAWKEGIARKQEMLREAIVKLAGTSGERRLDLALSASSHAHNERMVHEILVDLPALLEDIRNPVVLPEEAWNKLRTELSESPPLRNELATRLADISVILNAMTPGSFELERTSAPLDLDADFAVSVVWRAAESLKKSQAEAFDDALEEWLDDAVNRLRNSREHFVGVVVDVLKELTKLIRRIHSNVLLYRVRHSVPVVQQYGTAWERAHFKSHVESGTFSTKLPRTKKLLREVLQGLEVDEAFGHGELRTATPSTIRLMTTTAIANLATEMEMRASERLPELLHLDQERIVKMQNDVQRCAVVGSLDNIGRQYLHSKSLIVSPGIRNELLKVTEKQDATLRDIEDTFVEWIRGVVGKQGSVLSESDNSLLRRMVGRTVQPNDATFGIILKRVREAIVEVAEQMASARARSSSDTSKDELTHSKRGLEGVNELILDVSGRVCALVQHILSVHGESVQEVLRSVLTQKGDAAK